MKRPRVNLEKQLALLDESALLVALSHEVTGNLCPDVGVCESVECADPLAKNWNVLLLHLHHLNFRTGRRPRAVLCSRGRKKQAGGYENDRSAHYEGAFQSGGHVHLQYCSAAWDSDTNILNNIKIKVSTRTRALELDSRNRCDASNFVS